MSMIKDDLKYTKFDEWVKIEEDIAIVGITDYAQKHLGDIVFVEIKEQGETVQKGEVLTSIESVKSASDIYAPLSGEIVEMNQDLENDAGLVNQDPFGKGWIAKIKLSNPEEINELMDSEAYTTFRQD